MASGRSLMINKGGVSQITNFSTNTTDKHFTAKTYLCKCKNTHSLTILSRSKAPPDKNGNRSKTQMPTFYIPLINTKRQHADLTLEWLRAIAAAPV